MSHILLKAAEKNDLQKLEDLFSKGADVDYADKGGPGRTALTVAALSGHAQAVALLIKRGAKLDYQDRAMGFTPLAWACSQGHIDVVRLLIKAGANLNLPSKPAQISPLIVAAAEGHADIVKLLIEAGADLHAQTDADENALTMAQQRRRTAIVEILRRNGLGEPVPKARKPVNWQALQNQPELKDARSLVYEFVKAWSDWETLMASKPDPFKEPTLKALHAANLAKYCTPRKRVYVDGGFAFSPNLTYADVNDATLIGAELVSPTRVHLDFKCQWQTRRFVVMKKKSGWLLDSIKWKVSDSGEWNNGLIGS